jgi:glycine/D-amino acid oxidase-like deaminating enzyme
MKRRSFFKLFAGLAVGTLPGDAAGARRGDRVVVVGGGIVGASIAYHLSLRGAEVTVLEQKHPASGTTEKSFAWVNAHFSKQPRHYHRLNRLSTLAYRHLENELGGELDVRWGGALEWFGDPEQAARLRSRVKQSQQWGYPARLVDEEEFHQLERQVVPGAVLAAAYSELDGNVDPVQATEILLSKAREAGARVEYPCEVTALEMLDGVAVDLLAPYRLSRFE